MENTDAKVNDIINGFPHPDGVHAWARNLRVTEIDYPLGPEGKGVRAVDEKGTHFAFRYDEFEIISRAIPAETTTERVTVDSLRDLRKGDVVVEDNHDSMWVATIVERQVPAKPAEPEFGHGTAYVFDRRALAQTDQQKRYRGFKSTAGWFYFLLDDGRHGMASPLQYEGFRLED